MLMDFCSVREKDAVMLRDKLAEVDNLRNGVERLAGEVVMLRVVEEGLRGEDQEGNVGVDVLVYKFLGLARMRGVLKAIYTLSHVRF